jgi:hypothetical protein
MAAEFAGLGWPVFVGAAFQPCNIDLYFFQLLGSNSSTESPKSR